MKSQQLIEKFMSSIVGFNLRELDMLDLRVECSRLDIQVSLDHFEYVQGLTIWDRTSAFLFINNSCSEEVQIFAGFHEFAHILYHAPDTRHFLSTGKLWNTNKAEREANIIGAIALMPDAMIDGLTAEDVMWKFNVPLAMARFRLSILG